MLTPDEQEQAIHALRDAYAAFNRGDIAAAVEPMDSQIERSEPAEFPGGGIYHGQEGVMAYLTQSRASAAEVHSEPEKFIPAGDRIVVFVHARVRAHNRDVWQDVRLADVYTFHNGKPCRCGHSQIASRRCGGSECRRERPARAGSYHSLTWLTVRCPFTLEQ